jgi:hypothetical protein
MRTIIGLASLGASEVERERGEGGKDSFHFLRLFIDSLNLLLVFLAYLSLPPSLPPSLSFSLSLSLSLSLFVTPVLLCDSLALVDRARAKREMEMEREMRLERMSAITPKS